LRHALKYRLDVIATVAEIDERCHSRISNHPQGKAGNDLVKLLGCLNIRDEAERDASGYWSACHYDALLSKLFGLVECRENNAFDEGASGVFGKRLACFYMVKLDQEFHFGVLSSGIRE
jgi:hypothetical protein